MNASRICPSCGNPLPADAPAGLCPVCLLKTDPSPKPAAKGRPGDPGSTLAISPDAFARARFFGDYELKEEIARGGMGVVWKARQTSLNRTVALKMILAGTLAGEAEVQRFRREAEAAANLQHPNIVAIHEVGERDGRHYYSMDYVEGRDLGEWARESVPLPPARAAECLKTIAEAVHFAHQRGTLHRDLKPQNVLMDAAGVPRITDFGLAKLIERDDSLTQTGAAMGSPSYMPPEQAAGHLDQVGPHSDVYALGAILYELLTGRPPFREETLMATMRQVIESDPVAPRKINPAVPPDLETICLKCLEKNPARRYHSAQALADDLERFIKHEPVQALPVSPFRKFESWVRRHPWTLMAVVSLVAMVLAGLLYWQYERVKFLEYRQSHPLEVSGKPGLRAQELKTWDKLDILMYVVAVLTYRVFRQFARGKRSWKQFFGRSAKLEPNRPVSQTVRVVCGLVGVAGLAFTALYFAKIIQASVWENMLDTPSWMIAYASFFFNAMLLFNVLRDYQKFVHGSPGRALPAAQGELLRQAIFSGDIRGAARLYRRTFPGVSRDESTDFVARFAAELQAKEPEKFAPPRKLWDLNWRAMGVCLMIELCALAAAFRMQMLSVAPVAKLSGFGAGYLFGLSVIFSFRLKLFPIRIVIIAASIMVGALSAPQYYFGTIYFAGFASGVLMMASGSARKRRKSAAAG